MAKKNKIFLCNNCGHESAKWLGQCPMCNEWGTFVEFAEPAKAPIDEEGEIKKISSIQAEAEERRGSGFSELDRVLGGSLNEKEKGFVKGQVVLIGGNPGVGKSTLLLQAAGRIAEQGGRPLYISAEESDIQITLRANRILPDRQKEQLSLLNAFNLENILAQVEKNKYDFIVIDSIQTIYSSDVVGIPGSISQVRTVTSKLVNFAKKNGVTMVLIGHITKGGEIAGPKLLEHIVDTVFQLEGEDRTGFRILRSLKNRFGSTQEVGMFSMDKDGFMDLEDPSAFFRTDDSKAAIGVCKTVVMEGDRPLIIEVQALTSPTAFSLPKRVAEGVSVSRLQRICAILNKYGNVKLADQDVYLKLTGGMKFNDPVLDTAIAVAIISSSRKAAINNKVIALGELNLTGRISKVVRIEDRIKEAKRLGYTNIIDAKSAPDVKSLMNSPLFSK